MSNIRKEEVYPDGNLRSGGVKRVLGIGAVAAISAFAGGLAVTLWHRKTLEKLQNPIPQSETAISEFMESGMEVEDIDGF